MRKTSLVFLVMALVAPQVSSAEEVRIFQTTAGIFKVETNFGSYTGGKGNQRHEMLTTPEGKKMRLFPYFRPDGTDCFEGGRGFIKCQVVEFSSIGGKVFLITGDGLWQWRGHKFVRVDSWEYFLQVDKKFTTTFGDVYTFIPNIGDYFFRGILFYDKKERGWVRAEDGHSRIWEVLEVDKNGGIHLYSQLLCVSPDCKEPIFFNLEEMVFEQKGLWLTTEVTISR